MTHHKLLSSSFVNAIGTLAYISLVAAFMVNAEKVFGEMINTNLAPVVFLLLFVVSAAITASLVLGRPVLMYLDGQKKEAVRLFLYTVGWLFVFLCVTLAISLIV